MATSKSGGSKSKKVMDVGKPSETRAGATSKPVITGHKPLIGDPMVREDVPVSELSPTDNKDKPSAIPETEPETVSEEAAETETPIEELAVAEVVEPKPAATKSAGSTKSANSRFKPSDELVEEVNKASKTEKTAGGSDSGELKSDGAIGEVLGDAKGVKEAEVAELERQDEAKKLAASGKYRVKLGTAAHHRGGFNSPLSFGLIMLLLVLVLGYLAIDSGFYKSNINLPFHIFKQSADESAAVPVTTAKASNNTPSSTGSTNKTATPAIPANFTDYKMVDSGTEFAYPSVWGNVLVTPEKGYTKRDSSLSSDGVYAYLASFSNNQDVRLAVTSQKYLPVARDRLYYDYLQWCTGASDGKYYASTLTFKTASGVDTPDKISCDQGPLSSVTKVDAKTIQQVGVTADGKGDIYTQNLDGGTDIVVLHILDSTGKNASDIKKILATVSSTGSSN